MLHAFEFRAQYYHYFKFEVPASVFGCEDHGVLELSIEFGEAESGSENIANIWVREKGSSMKDFVYSLPFRASDEPDTAITEAMNRDKGFCRAMQEVIAIL